MELYRAELLPHSIERNEPNGIFNEQMSYGARRFACRSDVTHSPAKRDVCELIPPFDLRSRSGGGTRDSHVGNVELYRAELLPHKEFKVLGLKLLDSARSLQYRL